ncbi:MAG: hypothetical protein JEZ00_11245 [Anaerolineaceae bacterium]|nr:hypothetical protein [Anaerolineaceae bacterium]
MVSRAWSTLKFIPFLMLLLFNTAGKPLQIASGERTGICQAAYGDGQPSVPDWLEPAQFNMNLSTNLRYDLLAGNLLRTGLVDGSNCPAGGLNADGSPDACGIALAWDESMTWQNQYDALILVTAQTYDLPPKVLKALIGVESQFWPASNWRTGEIGLGQMTEMGADMLLTWHTESYQRICRRAFGLDGCDVAYHELDFANQRILRGFVLQEIDATCPICPGGVDPAKADRSIQLLAETLQASCLQTASLVWEYSGKQPAALMSYEDYWRLVLANYHSGAGCTLQAISQLKMQQTGWAWRNIANQYAGGCASGAIYIRRIEEQIKP